MSLERIRTDANDLPYWFLLGCSLRMQRGYKADGKMRPYMFD
jgi:hypothetical protein